MSRTRTTMRRGIDQTHLGGLAQRDKALVLAGRTTTNRGTLTRHRQAVRTEKHRIFQDDFDKYEALQYDTKPAFFELSDFT